MLRARFRTVLISAFGLAALAAIAVGSAAAKSSVAGTTQVLGQAGVQGTIVGTNIKNHLDVTVTSVPVGESVHAQVGVSGFHGTPTGVVFVSWYMTADCSGTSALGWTETLVNGQVDNASHVLSRNDEGYRAARALYKGDATYAAQLGPCTPVEFHKTTPGINLTIHNANHVPVASLPFTETVHAEVFMDGQVLDPTGLVLIRSWANGTCTGTDYEYATKTLDDDGRADSILPLGFAAPGQRSYKAHYSGDGGNLAVWSECMKVGGTKIAPLLITSLHDASHEPAPAAALVGEQIHPRIQVVGDFVQPTGNVQVLIFHDATCTNDVGEIVDPLDKATADNPYFDAMVMTQPGVFSWRVAYGGDSIYTMAKGDCLTQRWYAKPDVALSIHNGAHGGVSSVATGTTVHLRTDVTGLFGTPTGSATIRVADNASCSNGASLGTGALSGGVLHDSSIDYTPKAAGTVWFQATYKGDGNYVQRKSACVALTVTSPATSTPAPTTAPGPTAKPTTAPTSTPSPTAKATTAPGAGPSAAPTSVPTSGGQPSAAPAASEVPASTAEPGATAGQAAAASDTPAAGGSRTTGTGSSSGDLPILPIALLLVLLAVVGLWFIGAGRRRQPEAAR